MAKKCNVREISKTHLAFRTRGFNEHKSKKKNILKNINSILFYEVVGDIINFLLIGWLILVKQIFKQS